MAILVIIAMLPVCMQEILINHVQKKRKRMKITQEEMAEAVGVTRQTIIAIEKGNYTPSVTLAIKIAKFFKEPVEKIFKLKK
jgi:putative transcriptional regulator